MSRRGITRGPRIHFLLVAGALALPGSLICSIGGCITINIYFPAAAAERAADRIIDDVLGKGADAPPAPPAK